MGRFLFLTIAIFLSVSARADVVVGPAPMYGDGGCMSVGQVNCLSGVIKVPWTGHTFIGNQMDTAWNDMKLHLEQLNSAFAEFARKPGCTVRSKSGAEYPAQSAFEVQENESEFCTTNQVLNYGSLRYVGYLVRSGVRCQFTLVCETRSGECPGDVEPPAATPTPISPTPPRPKPPVETPAPHPGPVPTSRPSPPIETPAPHPGPVQTSKPTPTPEGPRPRPTSPTPAPVPPRETPRPSPTPIVRPSPRPTPPRQIQVTMEGMAQSLNGAKNDAMGKMYQDSQVLEFDRQCEAAGGDRAIRSIEVLSQIKSGMFYVVRMRYTLDCRAANRE